MIFKCKKSYNYSLEYNNDINHLRYKNTPIKNKITNLEIKKIKNISKNLEKNSTKFRQIITKFNKEC